MTHNKRIAICLDGTWQNPYKLRQRDDGSRVLKPSNVLKLSRAVLPTHPEDRRPQLTHYDAGLGSLVRYPGRANRSLSLADRFFGGVWGAGFEAGIEEAFRFLTHNHEPGDQVFVFGFSRGAAQARALTRFLDWLGGVPVKSDAYFGPMLFLHWIRSRGQGDPSEVTTVDGRRPDHDFQPVRVELLAVWDTVVALGTRLHAGKGTSTGRWRFFVGSEPAGCVVHARQALAIDERRFDFQPEIWLDRAEHQTLRQRWFAGSHSNVGGGYVLDGLANIPFRWLVNEAAALGLAVDEDYINHFNPYPQARLYPSSSILQRGLEIIRLRFSAGRRSLVGHPASAGLEIDRSVIHRLRADPAEHEQLERYRPANLIEYLAGLEDLGAELERLGFPADDDVLPEDIRRRIDAAPRRGRR